MRASDGAAAAALDLVGAALQGRRLGLPPHSEEWWRSVLGICAAQNVHTLVFDSLPDDVPEAVRSLWRDQAHAVQKHNSLCAAIIDAQEKAWRREGLGYALIKGADVAALYPQPLRRGAGDIDWYFVSKEDFINALSVVRRNPECRDFRRDSDGDVRYTFRGVVIEHHRDWTHLSSRRLRRLAGPAAIGDGRLSAEDRLFMLECHVLHHLAFGGVCLKQLCDVAVAMDSLQENSSVEERMRKVGLSKWHDCLRTASDCLMGRTDPMDNVIVGLALEDGCGHSHLPFRQKLRRIGLSLAVSKRETLARSLGLFFGRFTSGAL